jgi:hypothetical protein
LLVDPDLGQAHVVQSTPVGDTIVVDVPDSDDIVVIQEQTSKGDDPPTE